MNSNVSNTTENTLSRIVSFIPEQLINDIYLKIINYFKIGIKTKFSFYLTILYNGNLIRSRTLNSKGDSGMNSEIHETHLKFFQKAKSKMKMEKFHIDRYSESEEMSITILQVGNISIIVSNEDERAVEICSSIIGILLLYYRSLSLKKEGVQLKRLIQFFNDEENRLILWYLNEIEQVQKGVGSF
jgi:hypothetical protein